MALASTHRASRRGVSMPYLLVTLSGLFAIISLAVDFGRVQIAKTQLRAAADNIARYAASGLAQGVSTTQSRATTAAADNKVDGQSLSIDVNTDLEFGVWDSSARTFTVLTGASRASATAVRVTVRRTAARGNPVPTVFAALLGRHSVDVTATAIAARGLVIAPVVDADACPWLAGMPNGSQVAGYGGNTTPAVAPAQSPLLVSGLPITPGGKLYFRQTSGTTSYQDAANYGPDGNTGFIVAQQAVNGINTTKGPLNSLVGIFLDDRAPNTWAQAASLDFSTAASRDFTTLSPGLKQVFFIGDGLNSSGQLQEFVIPAGATRFYLGIMDEKGWWWDNTGTLSTSMLNDKVTLVQ